MGSSIFSAMRESTQIHEYDQGLPPYYAISRNKKWTKMFPLLVAVLIVIILIDFLPPSQERCHWIKSIGVRVRVADFYADDGVSLYVS